MKYNMIPNPLMIVEEKTACKLDSVYSVTILFNPDFGMTTRFEIAEYFIWMANETGSFISHLKLQKLVYYS